MKCSLVSEIIQVKQGSNYLIGHLDKNVRPSSLIMSKMSGYVKTFRYKKLMSFCINNDELLEEQVLDLRLNSSKILN